MSIQSGEGHINVHLIERGPDQYPSNLVRASSISIRSGEGLINIRPIWGGLDQY